MEPSKNNKSDSSPQDATSQTSEKNSHDDASSNALACPPSSQDSTQDFDVDEFAESRRSMTESSRTLDPTIPETSNSPEIIPETDLAAITQVLEEVDREAEKIREAKLPASTTDTGSSTPQHRNKHTKRKSQPGAHAVAGRPPAQLKQAPRTPNTGSRNIKPYKLTPQPTHTTPPPPSVARKPTREELEKQKEKDLASHGDSVNPVLLRHLVQEQQQLQSQPGAFHSSNSELHLQQPGKEKEADAVGEDDSVNPVLLRHLADQQQPGAYDCRSSNRSADDAQEDCMHPPAPMPDLSAHTTQSQSTMSMIPRVPSTQSHNGTLVQSPSPPAVIQASLAPPPAPTVPQDYHQNSTDYQDIERPLQPPIHADGLSPQDFPTVAQASAPAVVQAMESSLTDFLQNRTFVLFLGGYICAIATIAALVVGLVVQQNKQSDFASLDPNNCCLQAQVDVDVVVESADQIMSAYLDTTFNHAQASAFTWLNTHPEIDSMPLSRKVQLYALMSFYFAMQFRDWPLADRKNIASTQINECQWIENLDVQVCDQQNVLTKLKIVGSEENEDHFIPAYYIQKVRGTIPAEVAFLKSLDTIHIAFTDLNAELDTMLPWQLESLENLTTINFASNQLQGSIPTRIARMQKLRLLSLASNLLISTIPKELGRMTRLTSLDLSGNNLSGVVPTELANLQSLPELSLHSNKLRGMLPLQLSAMTGLKTLELHNNQFNGTIPTQLGLLTNVETLQLWGNNFTGPIPTELGLLTSLRFLDINANNLSGSVPTEIAKLTKLERFLLWENDKVIGPIPDAVCQLPALKRFTVDCFNINCQACGCTCYNGLDRDG